VEARFVTCTRFLRLCVHVGLQRGANAGFRTIAPILRYRNVVPQRSGAFKLFDEGRRALRKIRTTAFGQDEEFVQDQLKDVLENVTSATRQMFGKFASPTDINERGSTLLHVSQLCTCPLSH
jgi:hypothetical protein